jgi:hypothetical protein
VTTTTAGANARAPYLEAVAEALRDVPEPERGELLDDLADHLAELEAEHGERLADRLGAPATYAAELVASAGLAGHGAPEAGARLGARDAARRWVGHPAVAAVRRFAAEARAGWWVVRAWLACVLVAAVGDGEELFPVPDVLGHPLLSTVALAGAAVLSVRVGRVGGRAEQLATVVGVVGLGVALVQGQPRTEYVYADSGMSSGAGHLQAPDGRPIWNIWPYDGEGNPLDGVLLFDQDGVPLSTGDPAGAGIVEPGQLPIPGLYPLPAHTIEYDPETGRQGRIPVPPPEVQIPRLPASSTTAATTPTTATAGPAVPVG